MSQGVILFSHSGSDARNSAIEFFSKRCSILTLDGSAIVSCNFIGYLLSVNLTATRFQQKDDHRVRAFLGTLPCKIFKPVDASFHRIFPSRREPLTVTLPTENSRAANVKSFAGRRNRMPLTQ